MDKSEDIKELAIALNKAQSEMSGAKKKSDNPFFKSKYADLSEIIEIAKKPLSDNGLSFSQLPISEDTKCGVETILMHISGQWISNKLLLAFSKQDPQAYGSAITYARRYSLQAILGIPSEDDDGNYATHSSPKPVIKATDVAFTDSPGNAPDKEINKCACGNQINGPYTRCYTCNMKGR